MDEPSVLINGEEIEHEGHTEHEARGTLRLKPLTQVHQRQMTYREVAEHLQVCECQGYRLMHRHHVEVDAGLIHRLLSKPSNRGHDASMRRRVVGPHRQQYADYGPPCLLNDCSLHMT